MDSRQNRLFLNYFDSFSTQFSTFGAALGTHFRTLFPTLGPKGTTLSFLSSYFWNSFVFFFSARNSLFLSGVEKLTRSSSKGFLNRALFAYKNGRFASSLLLLGIGLL